MERYIVSSKLKNSLSQQRPAFHSHISLPPNAHLRHPPNAPLPRLEPPKLTRAGDTEISIFDADRYFNDHPKRTTIILEPLPERCNPRDSPAPSLDGYGQNRNIPFPATPTASSEASWNSQAGLLANPPDSLPATLRNTPSSTRRRHRFRLNCCTGRKSVDVNDSRKVAAEPKTLINQQNHQSTHRLSSIQEKRESESAMDKTKVVTGFSPENPFPGSRIVNNTGCQFKNGGRFSFPVAPAPAARAAQLLEPARDSLEVFQPAMLWKSADLQRRAVDDDAMSDASSDLFEIESLSTYGRRDSFGGSSAAGILQLREDCYPPSEVSVDWSVMTAEGFDRASEANFSECGEFRYMEAELSGGGGAAAGVRRRGLLGCVCENAVAVRPGPERRGVEPDGVVRVQSGNRISRSYSARMTRPVQRRLVV